MRLVPGGLDLIELVGVDETEHHHAVDDDDPPEDVDADAPPLVEQLQDKPWPWSRVFKLALRGHYA